MALDFQQHAHPYQRKGAEHLWNSTAVDGIAALWLDPGYGKTMIVLHAFKALYDAGLVKNMLIIAPLRVAQTVWAQEIAEWSSLNGLRAAKLHGPKKEKQLERRDVNIWIVNYEGVPWATKMAKAGKLPQCEVVVFDEVRRMKNSQGKRFKSARPLVAMAKYKWGLTGTPASNGLMDLFGQFLILDDGVALGKFITHFRNNYFEKGFDGFSWLPRPGAKEAIEQRIAPYIFRADGFLDLPELVPDNRRVPLAPATMKKLRQFKRDLLAEFEGTEISAANAAVLFGKLKQLANGRVYDEDRNVVHIHDHKKEALEELMDELGDEQLLIAYEYNHDLQQLREFFGDELPYLGAGVNEKTAMSHVNEWNEGNIRVLAAHPASAGHGLNLQKSSAHHILWFSPTIDLDHYIQFIRRLLRQGSKASHVVVHTFVAENTVDESVIVSRTEKDGLQSALLSALTVEFGDNIIIDEQSISTEDFNAMSSLQFKSDAQQGQAPAQPGNPFAPQAQAPAPVAAPAPAPQAAPANPFAPQGQAAPAPAPASHQPPANPFAGNGGQQAAIQQDVAAPAPAAPDPSTAPANPFAAPQGQATPAPAPAPVEQAAPAPAATPVVEHAPVGTEPDQNAKVDEGPEISVPSAAVGMVPVYVHVPADKLDKVFSAIGRAVK